MALAEFSGRSGWPIGNLLVTVEKRKQGRGISARRPQRHRMNKGNHMALTRNFKQTVVERVEREPEFAKSLLDEAATLFLSGEPETARLLLRDLVNATIGFEQLAAMTDKPCKSLHRMLSPSGNPSMDNLAAIFGAVRARLKVGFEVHTVEAA
jgi:DNA-binding phage protein